MPAARRVRVQDASDTDGDDYDNHETPRPQRANLKKRFSEVHPADDGSFSSSDPTRIPLKSVSLNDDAAEKRRRRKSTKLAVIDDLAMGGPAADGADDQEHAESSRSSRQKQQINTVEPPAEMNVPPDVMSSNFEEWMKMATDNVWFSSYFSATASLSCPPLYRKSTPLIHGTLPSSTIFMTCRFCETPVTILSTSSVPHARSTDV
jgi:hypothetical protein